MSLTDFSCLIRIPSLHLSLTSKICISAEKQGLSQPALCNWGLRHVFGCSFLRNDAILKIK